MNIQAILFDLGGTLIEYAGPYAHWPELETPGLQIAYSTLQEKGVPMPPFDAYQEKAFVMLPERWKMATLGERNLRLVDLLAEILATFGIQGIPVDWVAAAAERYQEAICSQATMIAGAPQILTWMKAQGYQIGLLSNTMFSGAAHIADLRRFDLDGYFDATLFSADAGMWKPSPAPYLELLTRMGVPAEQGVFIGDDPFNDILGGNRAGLKTIHIKSSGRFQAADGVHPDAVIDDLGQLPEQLALWSNEV